MNIKKHLFCILSVFILLFSFASNSSAVKTFPNLVAGSQTIEPQQIKQNDISIEYAWSLIGVESLDGDFYITNNSDETIRYLANNFGQSNPFWIRQNNRTKRVNLPYLTGMDAAREQELKPKESTVLSIPVPQNDKPFEAGFNFRVGIERKEKIIWVKFEKQLKSNGLTCSEEIKKAGGVLSKTCITPMIIPN